MPRFSLIAIALLALVHPPRAVAQPQPQSRPTSRS